jgi:hypothetical protein
MCVIDEAEKFVKTFKENLEIRKKTKSREVAKEDAKKKKERETSGQKSVSNGNQPRDAVS